MIRCNIDYIDEPAPEPAAQETHGNVQRENSEYPVATRQCCPNQGQGHSVLGYTYEHTASITVSNLVLLLCGLN